MDLSAIKASLRQHEGVKSLPYTDTEGVLTIGVGHNLQRPISDAVIDQMLDDDVRACIGELDRAMPDWLTHPEAVQNVLVELVFNLGWPRLSGFAQFRAALAARHYIRAADELLDSKWAHQVKGRAVTLANLVRGAK